MITRYDDPLLRLMLHRLRAAKAANDHRRQHALLNAVARRRRQLTTGLQNPEGCKRYCGRAVCYIDYDRYHCMHETKFERDMDTGKRLSDAEKKERYAHG